MTDCLEDVEKSLTCCMPTSVPKERSHRAHGTGPVFLAMAVAEEKEWRRGAMATSEIIYDSPWSNNEQAVCANTPRDDAARPLSLCDVGDPRSDCTNEKKQSHKQSSVQIWKSH